MGAHPFRTWVYTVAILVLVAGCASSPPAPVRDTQSGSGTSSARTNGSDGVTQALYDQFDRWRGTRYRFGGMGREGIDCSGLTYVVYRDVFGKQLPRTTEDQGKVGRGVRRRGLAPGDLVFFKTGVFRKHVGIYVEDGMFIHASRSGGVRISRLDDTYWHKRYWKARRLSI